MKGSFEHWLRNTIARSEDNAADIMARQHWAASALCADRAAVSLYNII